MKTAVLTYIFFLNVFITDLYSQDKPALRFHGIRVFVTDVGASTGFYEEILGLDVLVDNSKATTSFPIYISKATGSSRSNYPFDSRSGLTVQSFKLLPTINYLTSKDVIVYDTLLRRNGVGISIPFNDPSGIALSLMEVQIREIPRFEGFKVYNTGVTISDMDRAIDFYIDVLGFEEWSRNYLPAALPLKHRDGTFAFMIHQKENLKKNPLEYGDVQMVLLFETSNVRNIKKYLSDQGVHFEEIGTKIICKDPEGNSLEIFENVQRSNN